LKIDPSRIQRLLSAYKVEKPSAPKRKEQPGQVDEVQLSAAAQTFQLAFKAAMDSADIRSAKVENIKSLYDAGQYNVNVSKVVESIIDHAFGKR